MSREQIKNWKPATVYELVVTYKCDKCGKNLDPDGYDAQPNELIILLNQEECVNQKFRKDLCSECLEPIWLAICTALGVDPEDISGSDFDND